MARLNSAIGETIFKKAGDPKIICAQPSVGSRYCVMKSSTTAALIFMACNGTRINNAANWYKTIIRPSCNVHGLVITENLHRRSGVRISESFWFNQAIIIDTEFPEVHLHDAVARFRQ